MGTQNNETLIGNAHNTKGLLELIRQGASRDDCGKLVINLHMPYKLSGRVVGYVVSAEKSENPLEWNCCQKVWLGDGAELEALGPSGSCGGLGSSEWINWCLLHHMSNHNHHLFTVTNFCTPTPRIIEWWPAADQPILDVFFDKHPGRRARKMFRR